MSFVSLVGGIRESTVRFDLTAEEEDVDNVEGVGMDESVYGARKKRRRKRRKNKRGSSSRVESIPPATTIQVHT